MRRLILITLLVGATTGLNAQRMGGLHFSPGRFGSNGNGSVHGSGFSGLPGFGRYFRSGFYPLAFGDPLYADYLYDQGYPVASQPPVIVMQAPQAGPIRTEPAPEVKPLMLELQGGRYVRVREDDASGGDETGRDHDRLIEPRAESETPAQTRAVRDPAPAILVFRDGHREEASDYTIVGGVLYTQSNYYVDGSSTRKIDLSSLNIPETVASNQARGKPFRLPTAPNEVMVGP